MLLIVRDSLALLVGSCSNSFPITSLNSKHVLRETFEYLYIKAQYRNLLAEYLCSADESLLPRSVWSIVWVVCNVQHPFCRKCLQEESHVPNPRYVWHNITLPVYFELTYLSQSIRNLTHYRPAMLFGNRKKYFRGSFSSVLLQFFNYLGIFQSFKLRILIEKKKPSNFS